MAGGFLRCTLPADSWGIKRQRTECRRPSPPPSLFVSRDEEDCILGLLKLSGAAPLILRLGVPPPQAPKKRLIFPPPSSPPSYPISFPGLMPLLPPPTPPEQNQSLLSSPSLKQGRLQQNETLSPPTPSTADLRRYECSKCRKTFFSYQALGGHQRIHRKRRSPCAQKSRDTSRREEQWRCHRLSVTEYSLKKGRAIDLNQPAIEKD